MKPTVPGRLVAHRLAGPRFETPGEVVRHLGCVQSQLHDMGLWAIARRTDNVTLADLQTAFDAGDFSRTHVLRPTWHFVDPADLRWMLHLTAPRIRRLLLANASGPDPGAAFDRSAQVIVQVLADGKPHVRVDLGEALAAAGLPGSGQPMADLVMNAEIAALIVNGPMQGRQHTYRLLPHEPVADTRDELLARMARRYAAGHGPVRDKDLAWWSGLTLTDSRKAIALGELRPLDVDGTRYWTLHDPVEAQPPPASLVSNFDEYISYARDPVDYEHLGISPDSAQRRSGLLLVDGRLAGTWSRTMTATRVEIAVTPGRTLSPGARRAIEQESETYGAFVGRELRLVLNS